MLFPYAYGARHTKLVLRARRLIALCRRGIDGPLQLGAPLVLGELHGSPEIFQVSEFIPVVMTGYQLHGLYVHGRAEWHLRWYRLQTLHARSVRFEAGSKCVYPNHTQYYDSELLCSLADHLGERRAKKEVSGAGLPQD